MTEAFLGLTHKGPRHPPTEGTSTNLDIPVARSTSHSRDISHTAPKPYVISSDSTNSVKEQIRQLNQRLDEVQREFVKSKGELGESSKGRSPFVPVIQEKLVSTNFRLPALESYDSSSNPSEHVVAFRTQMALYDTSGAFMCGAFPTTLRDPARLWYSQLKPTSISSFDSFAREVELNFLASSQLRPTTDSLLGLTQGSKETLAQFVICFTVKFRGMPDVHPSLAIQAFLMGLRPSQFFWSLIERPPTMVPEMLQRANQYIPVKSLVVGKQDEQKRPWAE
ncbi:hypothetical protein BHE74_00039613 [Ensete ventricosum]|nr:hypothetical protein BHE74_00039613 [Ensete ventricosum]